MKPSRVYKREVPLRQGVAEFDEAKKKRLRAMIESGATVAEVRARFGVGSKKIRKFEREMNIQRKRGRSYDRIV